MKIAMLSLGAFALAFWSGTVPAEQEAPQKKAGESGKDEKADKARRRRVVSDLSGFDLLDQGKVKKESMVVGAARGFSPPTALAPRLGRLYGERPMFQWRDEGKAPSFVFTLTDEAQQELFRAETARTQWVYPADAPRLEPGRTYFWTVQALSPFASPSQPAGFLVMAGSQRAEIDRSLAAISATDPYEKGLAGARILTDHRLWYDAVTVYSDLVARFPDRPEAFGERGMIYAQLDITQALADQDFARAEALEARARSGR